MRLKKLIRCLKEHDIAVERPRRGSHWKFKKDGFRTYPVAAHNGDRTEVPDRYLRGLIRNFDLDDDALD